MQGICYWVMNHCRRWTLQVSRIGINFFSQQFDIFLWIIWYQGSDLLDRIVLLNHFDYDLAFLLIICLGCLFQSLAFFLLKALCYLCHFNLPSYSGCRFPVNDFICKNQQSRSPSLLVCWSATRSLFRVVPAHIHEMFFPESSRLKTCL